MRFFDGVLATALLLAILSPSNTSALDACDGGCSCMSTPVTYITSCYGLTVQPTLTTTVMSAYLNAATFTSLSANAFAGCNALTTLSLPTLSSIAAGALAGTGAISTLSMSLQNTVTLTADMFTGASSTGIKSLLISYPSVKALSANMFAGFGGSLLTLSLITVSSVGASSFAGLNLLTQFTLTGTYTSLTASALNDISGLNALAIPGGYSSISALDLTSLPNLTYLQIGSPVLTTIASNAFASFGLTKLTSLSFATAAAFTSLPDNAFVGLTNLKSLSLPAAVRLQMSAGTFNGLSQLTYLYAHNWLGTSIPAGVLSPLTSLKTFSLMSCINLVQVPANLFSGLNAFTSISMTGAKLTEIPPQFFPPTLKALIFYSMAATTLPPGLFLGITLTSYSLTPNNYTFGGNTRAPPSTYGTAASPIPCDAACATCWGPGPAGCCANYCLYCSNSTCTQCYDGYALSDQTCISTSESTISAASVQSAVSAAFVSAFSVSSASVVSAASAASEESVASASSASAASAASVGSMESVASVASAASALSASSADFVASAASVASVASGVSANSVIVAASVASVVSAGSAVSAASAASVASVASMLAESVDATSSTAPGSVPSASASLPSAPATTTLRASIKASADDKDSSSILIIVCAVAGTMLLILVVVALVRRKRRMNASRAKPAKPTGAPKQGPIEAQDSYATVEERNPGFGTLDPHYDDVGSPEYAAVATGESHYEDLATLATRSQAPVTATSPTSYAMVVTSGNTVYGTPETNATTYVPVDGGALAPSAPYASPSLHSPLYEDVGSSLNSSEYAVTTSASTAPAAVSPSTADAYANLALASSSTSPVVHDNGQAVNYAAVVGVVPPTDE
ncbi:hypothetical protein CAOG_03941 [Capsaspora owczarzaki ATCC 30864]|uniref:LRRNT domain-containing protein n=1 Tax=Capsaspora owczarzaki (strain ATCC 30864) TaxID=595528 RepID=A0A0D2VQU8_CAPO3|nr:hypothetical protein CAOG_03941 [Capsaspora owczarzaki ATCC 30864]KJE93102.1 hypothetical protein, variant 1 [Capsaspora owczarzaki ATCC 30864]|eukprot:XP_004363669.2 hypothetical protein CAOG_03941 [Capsaspora owczarzaki ATCC 30864]